MASRITIYVIVLLTILQAIFTPSQSAVILSKRAIKDDSTKSECQVNSPCGWAVYTPFTRKIDYFMKNSCECSPKEVCIRTDDDISVSAFVYRCKLQTTTNTISAGVTS